MAPLYRLFLVCLGPTYKSYVPPGIAVTGGRLSAIGVIFANIFYYFLFSS